MKQQLFALIDCNNFFASCERVFRPDLIGKPIVVLSSNDGCVVARSQESKDIGIPMGAPFFKFRDLIEDHDVRVFSSNFPLYQDMSARVMSVLSSYELPLQIYSVDEAFLDFSAIKNPEEFAHKIHRDIFRQTGIRVSVGIAKTKTLAKMGTKLAKYNQTPVFKISSENLDDVLEKIKIYDVWGIGRQHSVLLNSFGIDTALKFKQFSNFWIRKKLGVGGERIWYEIREISCLKLEEEHDAMKSMVRSRSFGEKVTDFETVFSAISNHVFNLTRDLRELDLLAKNFKVFIATNRFKDERYSGVEEIVLDIPTNDTIVLNKLAHQMLKKIFKSGFVYKKAGVASGILVDSNSLPNKNLFSVETLEKNELMQKIDQINLKYGEKTLQMANSIGKNNWRPKNSLCSPKYTTDWQDILTIKV